MKETFKYGDIQCSDCKEVKSQVIHYSKDLILCYECYRTHEKQEVNCCNCKFYDGYLCEFNYRSMAILDEVKTAKNCEHFAMGEFVDSDDHLIVDIQ